MFNGNLCPLLFIFLVPILPSFQQAIISMAIDNENLHLHIQMLCKAKRKILSVNHLVPLQKNPYESLVLFPYLIAPEM